MLLMLITDSTRKLFLITSKHRVMDNYLPKLRQCLAVLNTEQLWDHDFHEANSIGGIVAHICEQMRRHTAGYGQGGTVSAAGVENHFPDLELCPEKLLSCLEETFAQWEEAIDKFLETDPKSLDFLSVYHLVEHTSYHLGQIVDRVQRKTGGLFQFVQNGLNEQELRKRIREEIEEKKGDLWRIN